MRIRRTYGIGRSALPPIGRACPCVCLSAAAGALSQFPGVPPFLSQPRPGCRPHGVCGAIPASPPWSSGPTLHGPASPSLQISPLRILQ